MNSAPPSDNPSVQDAIQKLTADEFGATSVLLSQAVRRVYDAGYAAGAAAEAAKAKSIRGMRKHAVMVPYTATVQKRKEIK